jgi:hypothetical protein
MSTTAGDFFIVDNSDEHWKALEYLRQWCELSESVDVATGFFEIGALLALDGEWQKVDKFRILIGSETSRQTFNAIREAADILDKSLGAERADDPFLTGLDAVVQAIVAGKIEIKIYRKKKFHAKAYITHGRLDIVGSAALVGSSNFTKPGLSRNVELNVRFTGVEVRELQQWYQAHWDDAEDVTSDLLQVIERHARQYSPFDVYAKALRVLTEDVEPSATEWERNESRVYPLLAPYQREAYHGLKQRASRWNGAFLTDGVGLGKTFVGLMLTEYYAVKERKNVLIMATKTGQDAVWEPELRERLPDLTGEFTNVRVMAHTDLSTKDAVERVRRLADRVDVVIVDEGHNFRNHGPRGDEDDSPRSRWWRLQEICEGKTVFHLTATPINNSLFDFVHEFELFTGLDDTYFSSIGVPSVRTYFSNLERTFLDNVAESERLGAETVDTSDFDELLQQDQLLESLIVQNSRQYAKQSAIKAGGPEVLFPRPDLPRAVPYSYNLAYSALLSELDAAFARQNPLFVLPMYYPLAYSRDNDVDTRLENRQRQVVGLIRTTFLKRFESSIASFAGSCADLAVKTANWISDNSASMPDQRAQVERWWGRNSDLLQQVHEMFRPGVDAATYEPSEDDDNDDELFGEAEGVLSPQEYDVEAMIEAAFEDLVQLTNLLERAATVGTVGDEKYDQLLALLTGGKRSKGKDPLVFDPAFAKEKVIVFTEYADTARYLHERLQKDQVAALDRLDGSRKADRFNMIKRFAPHYNRVDAAARAELAPLRVLVSTDVLSEGVNLQDASLIVNYDIHWNPVRLMQRIGRVDRRLDKSREDDIVAESPALAAERGVVKVRNFLPPGELNKILTLYSRVQGRVLRISKTLGLPGGRLLTEEDMHDDVKVFNAFLEEYEGQISPLEALRLKYLDLLNDDPGLEMRLQAMPLGIHASVEGDSKGLFTCSVEPIRRNLDDGDSPTWTLDGGKPRWVFHPRDAESWESVGRIDEAISCEPSTPGVAASDKAKLASTLKRLRRERHEQLMRDSGLPLDAPTPMNVCWMEVR